MQGIIMMRRPWDWLQKSKPQPKYLPPKEVARRLKVHQWTVYRWIREGKVAYQQVGGKAGSYRVEWPIRKLK